MRIYMPVKPFIRGSAASRCEPEVALGEINPEGGAAPLDNNSYHDETVMNAKGISQQ
jgi:hypothetical protein